MTDEPTGADGTMSPSRLAQFEDEVAKLKVTGGGANPERLGSQWGIGLTILGFVIAIISWWSAKDNSERDHRVARQHLRDHRRRPRARRHHHLGAQLADAVPALLDHPARVRTARTDRRTHPRPPRREVARRPRQRIGTLNTDAVGITLPSLICSHRDEHLILPGRGDRRVVRQEVIRARRARGSREPTCRRARRAWPRCRAPSGRRPSA